MPRPLRAERGLARIMARREMNRMSRRAQNRDNVKRARRAARRGSRYTAGQYTGKFTFPNIRAKKDRSRVAYNGSQGTYEDNIEALTGANVAYLGVSSIVKGATSNVAQRLFFVNPVWNAMVGIIRKMFKKYYEIDVESVNQSLTTLYATFTGGTPTGIRMFYKKTPQSTGLTGAAVVPTIGTNTSHDITFGTDPVSDWARILTQNILLNPEYGAMNYSFATDAYELYGLAFIETIGAASALHGIYRVDNLKIHVQSTSTLHIQNQTTSDAGNTSYTVVDANPVKGRIFYFNDPNPILRFVNTSNQPTTPYKLMQDTNGDGLIYPDADPSQASGYSSPFTQLPGTDMFKNCKKYSAVSLAPGEMKKITLRFKFNGYLTRFLRGLAINQDYMGAANYFQGTVGQQGNLGTSLLFAFDKRLSTGTGDVELAIQRHVTCTVNIGKKTSQALQPAKWQEYGTLKDDTTAG